MRTINLAIGLAAFLGIVPAGFAQSSRKMAGAGIRTEQPEGQTGITLAVPVGRISLDPKSLDGEPIYVRRTTVGAGMTIVEVSTTPFMPVLASADGAPVGAGVLGRSDQPASW